MPSIAVTAAHQASAASATKGPKPAPAAWRQASRGVRPPLGPVDRAAAALASAPPPLTAAAAAVGAWCAMGLLKRLAGRG